MKFRIVRSKFLDGLKSVQNAVSAKGALPILQNVLLTAQGKELTMMTTDLDLSIKAVQPCDVEELGISSLPVKLLFNMVSSVAEGEIEIEIDATDRALIRAGSAKFKMSGLPEKDFPRLPKEDEEAYEYKIPKTTLREMLRKTAYASAQDDSRRSLKGVLMSFKDCKLTMVATDGRRLALVENELEFPQTAERDIVLPSKAVAELLRSLNGEGDALVKIQQSQISFNLEGIVIYSKLIDEVYPNYRQVIPNETKEHVAVDRQLLIDALERASVMSIDEAHSIKLIFSNGRLTVTSAASDVGEAKDEVPVKYAGEDIEIMFNPTYVSDPLKAIDDDEIMIDLNNGHSPAIIRCSIPFLYVLMPLRIS